jgi:hypothetical protein
VTGKPEGFLRRPRGIRLALLVVGAAALPLLLVAFVLFMMGLAHRGFDITYENRTGGDIEIFVDGEFETFIPANESKTFGVYNFHWEGQRLVEAKDRSDRVLFSARLSKEDLATMDYRVVVTER